MGNEHTPSERDVRRYVNKYRYAILTEKCEEHDPLNLVLTKSDHGDYYAVACFACVEEKRKATAKDFLNVEEDVTQ